MTIKTIIFILCILCSSCYTQDKDLKGSHRISNDIENNNLNIQKKELLDPQKQKVSLSCWDDNEERLLNTCKQSKREEYMRLAWDVMNCVFNDTGRKVYICKARDIKICTSVLPDAVMVMFTQFLNHIDNKCHYKETSNWQLKEGSKTQRILSEVHNTEDLVSSSLHNQRAIQQTQDDLLKQTNELNKRSETILKHINTTRSDLTSLFNDIKSIILEAKNESSVAFAKLGSLTEWIQKRLSDTSKLETIVFKSITSISSWIRTLICYFIVSIITNLSGLHSVRPILYLALTLSILLRLTVRWLFTDIFTENVLNKIENTLVVISVTVFGYLTIRQILNEKNKVNEKLKCYEDFYKETTQQKEWMQQNKRENPSLSDSSRITSRFDY